MFLCLLQLPILLWTNFRAKVMNSKANRTNHLLIHLPTGQIKLPKGQIQLPKPLLNSMPQTQPLNESYTDF